MSSAIEVLKEMRKSPKYDTPVFAFEGEALDEALLALEKQEKLKSWLEKEIKTMEDLERINYTGAFQNDLRILKEVLERVGEQK